MESTWQAPLLGAGFFLAMIIHEIALEGIYNFDAIAEYLPSLVTLSQFSSCVLVPLLIGGRDAASRLPRTPATIWRYVQLSGLVFGATALATASLGYVSYPTKVVFKSAKLIPTMVISTVVHGKAYGMRQYFAAILLCIGSAGYAFNSGKAASGGDAAGGYGIGMLTISIVCDSLVPNLQQKLMATEVTPGQLMVNLNSIGCVGVVLSMIVTGSFIPSMTALMGGDLHVMLYLAIIGLSLGSAVVMYTRLIQESGSVVAVAVATLRKCATMILSYILFPKPMTMIHVYSSLSVLFGVCLSSMKRNESTSTSDWKCGK